MRIGTSKWLSRFVLRIRRRRSTARLTRSRSSSTSRVLKLATSSERNAILKVIYEQAQDQGSMGDNSSDDSFQSCLSWEQKFVEQVEHAELTQIQNLHHLLNEQGQQQQQQEPQVAEQAELQLRELRAGDVTTTGGASKELRIYAVTWNMNGKVPFASLPKLLENGKGEYDLYVIGVQESPVSSLRRRLHPILGRHYNLVAKSVLGSLQLYVFGKSSLHVTGKKVDKVRFRGLGSVIGRHKGAVAASFCIGNSSFLFIASHFAAHENKVKERNVQYLRARKKIFSRPGMKACVGDAAVVESELQAEFDDRPQSGSTSRTFVDESDVVVWLGDLNYRIEGSKGLVKSFVKLNLEKLLWKRDQLFNAVDQGDAFKGFVEGPLAFKPTYKYDVGTDNYDTSDKERVPSWTDRILIKIKDETPLTVDVENYYSIDGLRTSDHRPVKALLRVTNLNQ